MGTVFELGPIFGMMWRRIHAATKLLSRIFKIFKNGNMTIFFLSKNMTWGSVVLCSFWKYFQNIWVFQKTQKKMSKTFSRWAPVANLSFISQKMAELSAFSFFSIPVTLYYQKNQMHVLACSKSLTRKQMVSLDSWAQTASDRHLSYWFCHI